jgi:opacity protein-like surface antigen
MKKLILAAAMAIGLVGAAQAQSTDRGMYIGANVGTVLQDNSKVSAGAVVGYQYNRFVRTEGTFDQIWYKNGNGQALMANAVLSIPTGTVVTPYALIGAGVGMNRLNTVNGNTSVALYNVGLGTRVAVSQNIDLDVRYRHFAAFESVNGRKGANMVTVGAAYKF